MTNRLQKMLTVFSFGMFLFSQPLLALAAEESSESPDWVMSYFLILLFLGLSIVILLRPSKRSDSAFSVEEIAAQHEEAMKKMKGH